MTKINPGALHVLQFVTDEWLAASDIADFARRDKYGTTGRLKELMAAGKVEKKWDGYLGVHYWRLARDKGFHRASDEVRNGIN